MVSDNRPRQAFNHADELVPTVALTFRNFFVNGRDWRIAALIFTIAFLFLMVTTSPKVNFYDEALVLVGATRVGEGAIPHRDFYVPYGPAQFYVLAELFKLLGPSVLVERLWDSAVRAAIVTAAFFVIQRAASRREAWVASALVLVWVRAAESYGYPVFPALLFALLAVLCLTPVFEGRKPALLLFGGGICLGVTVLFRYDIGAYAVVALSLVSAAYEFSRPLPVRERITNVIQVLLPCWLGVLVVCGPVALAFAWGGVLQDFYFDIIYFPTHYYRHMRALPFPGLLKGLIASSSSFGVYLPIGVWIAALITLARSRRSATVPRADSRPWIMALLGILSALFYLQGIVLVNLIHMTLSLVPALMLAAALLPYVKLRLAGRFAPAGVAVALIGLIFVVVPTMRAVAKDGEALVHTLVRAVRAGRQTASAEDLPLAAASCRPTQGLERMACFTVSPLPSDVSLKDIVGSVRYVEANSQPDDPIFVGLERHDLEEGNDILFYFESARRPATKWYHFDPGLQTSQKIQAEMIDELQIVKPAYVVLFPAQKVREPNESSVSTGVTLLDDFIRSNYERVQVFGGISVLHIKNKDL